MSPVGLVVAVAAITVGSRAVSVALLPPPRGTLAAIVDRLPAPLFAVLAAATLLGSDHASSPAPVWLAAAAALVTVRRRSLLLTVAAGLAGALVGRALA
jgi:MYXO-CTERM domain-containing protein